MKNLKIGARLGVGFSVVLLLLVALTVIGVLRLQSASGLTDELINVKVINERRLSEWEKIIEINAARTTAAWLVSNPDNQKQFEAQMTESSARATLIQNQMGPSLQDPVSRALYQEVLNTRQAYVDVRKAMFKAKKEGDLELGLKLFENDMMVKRNSYLDALHHLSATQRTLLDNAALSVQSQYQSGRILLIALGSIALILGMGFAIWITRSITRPIDEAVKVAEMVSDGDLTSRIVVSSRDETGQLMQALKNMNGNLVNIVGQVRSGTETMATASSEMAAGNLDLSSRTEQQASSLEETAASMEELTSTVKLNADNARQARQLATDASNIASRGGVVVSEVVATMGSINDSSRKIVEIISVIDSIAFQTNILALNAAVEAARAGEQGRGFAVVASEVRSLAQRSASAAKEIKGLIGDSVQKVEAGSSLVDKAGRTMEEIVQSIGRVTTIMGQITDASDEQRAGIEHVNQALSQMDLVTQQNAALVEQAAAAAESMQEEAARLAQVVGIFKLDAIPAARPEPSLRAAAPAAPRLSARSQVQAPAPKRTVAAAAGQDEWEEF